MLFTWIADSLGDWSINKKYYNFNYQINIKNIYRVRWVIWRLNFENKKITLTSHLTDIFSKIKDKYLLQLFWTVSLFKLVNVAIILGVTRSFIGLSLYFALYVIIKGCAVWGIRWAHVRGDVVSEIVWQPCEGSRACVIWCIVPMALAHLVWEIPNVVMHCFAW